MRRRGFLNLVVAAALFCSALAGGAAMAQGGRRGGMMGRQGGLAMLRIPEVQKELKMTPEQIGKLDAKQDEVREKMQGAFQGGGNPAEMSAAERQKLMERIQEIQSKAASEVLDATQQKRFKELELQQQGANAITRTDVATELKLTDDQKQKAAKIQSDLDAERRSAMQGVDFRSMSPEERTKMLAKMQEMQKAAGEKMTALLTEEQKAQWKTMLGAPFTFPAPTPGGGGRAAR